MMNVRIGGMGVEIGVRGIDYCITLKSMRFMLVHDEIILFQCFGSVWWKRSKIHRLRGLE